MAQSTAAVTDTIAAISTALGEGGIAIIRISGPDAVSVARKVLKRQELEDPGRMYLTSLLDGDGNVIDRVLTVRFARPRSYTGEDIIEIHTHGGILAARSCLALVLENGARIAEPGEFTRRAFINGRIDLAQAEGVLDVIRARSIEALHAAARTLTGELSRETQKIHDDILTLQAMNDSDICLYVVDSSREITPEEQGYIDALEGRNAIIVFSKSDIPAITHDVKSNARKVHVSSKEYTGIEELKAAVCEIASGGAVLNSGLNVSAQQLADIRSGLAAMNEALLSVSMGEDITAGLLNTARLSLLRVLGLDAGDEVINSMFSRFCVGK